MKQKITITITIFILAFISYLFYYCAGGTLLGSMLLLPLLIGFIFCYSIILKNANYFAREKEWIWITICVLSVFLPFFIYKYLKQTLNLPSF